MTRRPSALQVMREARQMGEAVRIIFTHAGDMVIEPVALTDTGPAPTVPHGPENTPDTATITAFQRRIDRAQRRA